MHSELTSYYIRDRSFLWTTIIPSFSWLRMLGTLLFNQQSSTLRLLIFIANCEVHITCSSKHEKLMRNVWRLLYLLVWPESSIRRRGEKHLVPRIAGTRFQYVPIGVTNLETIYSAQKLSLTLLYLLFLLLNLINYLLLLDIISWKLKIMCPPLIISSKRAEMGEQMTWILILSASYGLFILWLIINSFVIECFYVIDISDFCRFKTESSWLFVEIFQGVCNSLQ